MSISERARAIGRWLRRQRRQPAKSIHDTIAEARRAADAMNRPVRHNHEGPDGDLRHAPFGPLTP